MNRSREPLVSLASNGAVFLFSRVSGAFASSGFSCPRGKEEQRRVPGGISYPGKQCALVCANGRVYLRECGVICLLYFAMCALENEYLLVRTRAAWFFFNGKCGLRSDREIILVVALVREDACHVV